MSKLKLLLLGGIFVLFGIINFSSASSLYSSTSCNGAYRCQPSRVVFDECLRWSDVEFIYEKSDPSCSVDLFISTSLGSTSFTLSPLAGNSFSPGVFDKDKIYNIFQNSSRKYLYDELFCGYQYSFNNCSFPVTLTIKKYTPPIISNGFDTFTPAVEGVKTTLNQIIPLMVFIGIGVLVVTLGFIAICWLVNWLGGKIRSIFSSRK